MPPPPFIYDTGATTSVINDASLITPIASPTPLPKLVLANGTQTTATAIGHVNLTVDQHPIPNLPAQLHPSFPESLLSGPSLYDAGHRVVIDKTEGSTITFRTDDGDKNVPLKYDHKTFFVDHDLTSTEFSSPPKHKARMSRTQNLQLLHARLGCTQFRTILHMLDDESVANPPKCSTNPPSIPCATCLTAKANKHAKSSTKRTRTTIPGEVLHTDVVGPIIDQDGTSSFVLPIIDEATRYGAIIIMANKTSSSIIAAITIFIDTELTPRGYVCTRLHTDYEATLHSTEIRTWMQLRGIRPTHSAEYSKWQNGLIETTIRTINARTTAMMLRASDVPSSWWKGAMQSAMYVMNRTGQETDSKTPFEYFCHKRPDISNLRVWGSHAFVKTLPMPSGHKLKPKARHGRFYRYLPDRDGYEIRMSDTGYTTTINSHHVRFIETFDIPPPPFASPPQSSTCVSSDTDTRVIPHIPIPHTPLIPPSPPDTLPSLATSLATHDQHHPTGASTSSATPTTTTDAPSTHGPTSPATTIAPAQSTPITPPTTILTLPACLSARDIPQLPSQSSLSPWSLPAIQALINTTGSPRLDPRLDALPTHTPHTVTMGDFARLAHATPPVPTTFKQASKERHWRDAMDREFIGLLAGGTFGELQNLPDGFRALNVGWIYKVKTDKHGNVLVRDNVPVGYKARLVVKGYSQVQGIDFDKVFAPVTRLGSLRMLAALSAIYGRDLHQVDVTQAYIIADFDKEMYIKDPNKESGQVRRLLKALYGTKQAGRLWHQHLSRILQEYGFEAFDKEPSIHRFVSNDGFIIIVVYVDDIILLPSTDDLLHSFMSHLHKSLPGKVKDMGISKEALGLIINQHSDHNRRSVTLSQQPYAETLLERHNVTEHPTERPSTEEIYDLTPDTDATKSDTQAYQSIVGGLLYLSNATMPSIAYVNHQLCRFMHAPSTDCMRAARRALRYVKSNSANELTFTYSGHHQVANFTDTLQDLDPQCVITGFVDSNWRAPKSTTGWVFYLAGAPLCWCSQMQRATATSTSEAEWIAASSAAREAIYLRDLAKFCGIPQDAPTRIMEDNNGAIAWANELGHHNKRKHIDIATWNVYDHVKKNNIALEYIKSSDNKADCLTKSLLTKAECIAKFNALSGKTTSIELGNQRLRAEDEDAEPIRKRQRK